MLRLQHVMHCSMSSCIYMADLDENRHSNRWQNYKYFMRTKSGVVVVVAAAITTRIVGIHKTL